MFCGREKCVPSNSMSWERDVLLNEKNDHKEKEKKEKRREKREELAFRILIPYNYWVVA